MPVLPSTLGADIDGLGESLGTAEAFEALRSRWGDAHARQVEATPAPVAELMCVLVGLTDGAAPSSVLDPACGTGGLLLQAAQGGMPALFGQDVDPDLAEITSVRLRLHGYDDVSVASGDSLAEDAHATVRVQGVVCNPPSGQHDWGQTGLGYDTRWIYGLPPKGEPELAWLQHALAHLDDGGRAVLLMSAGVAVRPSGRRIRAELVRRGSLRAVVALPSGSARIPGAHLWLAEPGGAMPPGDVLFVDADLLVGPDPEQSGTATDWNAVHAAVASVWNRFQAGEAADTDIAISVSVTALLSDDVDVTPARHVRTDSCDTVDLERLEVDRAGWLRSLNGLSDALPDVRRATAPGDPATGGMQPLVSLDDLIRSGALRIWRGSLTRDRADCTTAQVPLLGLDDGLSRSVPSGRVHAAEAERIREGDVLVFAAAPETARPADPREYGAAAGQGVTVLRPQRASLDPWFLAGAMTGGPGLGRSGASAGATGRRSRLDTGRLFLPVRPPEEQCRIGRLFRDIARFEESLTAAVDQGRRVARQLSDALASGLVDPDDDRQR
ncbi:HsdM family class I SAM-dependent methyltransferase [Streptomyces klenkii]